MITRVLCMECDFEGEVSHGDKIYKVKFCPSCGEELEYRDEENYENEQLDLQE